MFCNQCGQPLPDNSRFCPLCGNAVSGASATPPPVQPIEAPASAPAQNPIPAGVPVYGQPVYYAYQAPAAPVAPAPGASYGVPVYAQPQATVPTTPIYAKSKAEATAAAAAATEAEPYDFDEPQEVVPEPTLEDAKPLSVGRYIVSLFALLFLPIGNIIFACVWGFRANENPHRRNLARAALPFITLGLLALFGILLYLSLSGHSFSLSVR